MPNEIYIGPDGTRYQYIGTMTTTPTSDMAPKVVRVHLKTFWKTERNWTATDIAEYRNMIPQLAEQIRTELYWDRQGHVMTNRFTCEDSAIRVLVQFAAARRLPVKLTTGVRTYRNIEKYGAPEHNRYESTMYGFADMVKTTFGAPDVQRAGTNTVRVQGPEALLPGDILALAYDLKGRSTGGRAHHVQVVTAVSTSAIEIYQGNSDSTIHWPITWVNRLFGRNSADPQQSAYAGTPIEQGRFTRGKKGWDYKNSATGNAKRDYLKYFDLYRWNFMEFNK